MVKNNALTEQGQLEIKETPFSEIEPFKKDCIKEKLYFNKNTTYFVGSIDNKIVGFVGIMWRKNKAILKNAYVLPEYRRQGIFKRLDKYTKNNIGQKGIHLIEANCTDIILPFHIKMGARIVKKYKICTKIIYENL